MRSVDGPLYYWQLITSSGSQVESLNRLPVCTSSEIEFLQVAGAFLKRRWVSMKRFSSTMIKEWPDYAINQTQSGPNWVAVHKTGDHIGEQRPTTTFDWKRSAQFRARILPSSNIIITIFKEDTIWSEQTFGAQMAA